MSAARRRARATVTGTVKPLRLQRVDGVVGGEPRRRWGCAHRASFRGDSDAGVGVTTARIRVGAKRRATWRIQRVEGGHRRWIAVLSLLLLRLLMVLRRIVVLRVRLLQVVRE